MKKWCFLLSLFSQAFAFQVQASDPSGCWETRDHKTDLVESLIQFWQTPDGTYSGKVAKIYEVNGHHKTDVCKTCSGDKKDQPFLNMTVIFAMHPDHHTPGKFIDGRAFDPTSDHVYHAQMYLSPDGQILYLRGYILFPLLGRTEVWKKAPSCE